MDEQDSKSENDAQWRASTVSVFSNVIHSLPGSANLGEIVKATRANAAVAPLLATLTVHELIEMVIARPTTSDGPGDDDEPAALDLDGGAAVIRRRADVPDGDLLMLESLIEHGPQNETQLGRSAGLTSEQVRLILRQLRSKSLVHVEGSGAKRKIKITRNGGGFLRKMRRRRQQSGSGS